MVTMDSLPIGDQHSSFLWYNRRSSTTSPSLKNGVSNAPLVICRILNGHMSTTGHPIHFMLCSRLWFSSSADRMTLFPVSSNSGWQPAAILENYSGIARFPCDSTAFLYFNVTVICGKLSVVAYA